MDTKKLFKHIPWVILGIIGAFCLAVVALRRDSMNFGLQEGSK